ncbi:hypothetical protein KCMC57_up62830 [Kitasatospora sp. CMC57]|uniref:GntR C-terminal domain-containing protein n=1 Tax=Kitasatospora sp. CMC57 TaxID=3231513 RepID=A0AB33K7P5_9ACTN
MPFVCSTTHRFGGGLLAGIAEAVRDRDERALRRLLARHAEQATLTDLPALREALQPRP